MSDEKHHYFYALALPDEAKECLSAAGKELQEQFPFKRWVHPLDLHITLAFLGNAPEVKLNASIKNLEATLNPGKFSLQIEKLGVFGKMDSPRIFWAGVNHEPKLNDARDQVYASCKASGFQLETRPFKPHITLARKWAGNEPFSPQLLEMKNPFLKDPVLLSGDKVVLYKTNLGKEPKYEPVKVFPLK
ncbi:RNA 2',3'-cyclic phosphodiesterase [Mesobacillus foraminis]|uniref:RNA 2',3'-cyclic phosphodiesterase n=1 Tax=Mesobacillus foraminis TaxID=279826 RepID=UPI0039A2A40C